MSVRRCRRGLRLQLWVVSWFWWVRRWLINPMRARKNLLSGNRDISASGSVLTGSSLALCIFKSFCLCSFSTMRDFTVSRQTIWGKGLQEVYVDMGTSEWDFKHILIALLLSSNFAFAPSHLSTEQLLWQQTIRYAGNMACPVDLSFLQYTENARHLCSFELFWTLKQN